MGTASSGDKRDSSLNQRLRDLLSNVLSLIKESGPLLLAVLAAMTFAYLRVLHVSFYRKLGVNPEEIGLGYSETLSKGFAALFVVTGYVALLVGVIAGGFALGEVLFRWATGPRDNPRSGRHALVVGIIIVISLLGVAAKEINESITGLQTTLDVDLFHFQIQDLSKVDEQTEAMVFSLVVTVGAIAILLALLWSLWSPSIDTNEAEGTPMGSSWVWLLLTAAALVLGGAGAYAGSLGERVAEGQELPPDSIVGSLTGLQAYGVTIECCTDRSLSPPPCATFLGSDGDTLTLYSEGRVWRVPTSDTVLATVTQIGSRRNGNAPCPRE